MQLICFIFLFSTPLFAEQAKHLETTPVIDNWGFDIGFGSQPYMERAVSIGVLSPYIFDGRMGSRWRVNFDIAAKTLQAYTNVGITEYALFLESNSKIYKDVVYSYTQFGLGLMTFEDDTDDFYDGDILTLPIAIGFQVVTSNTNKAVLSFFVEYRFTLYDDFDEDKSLVSQPSTYVDPDALFSGTTSFGIRATF